MKFVKLKKKLFGAFIMISALLIISGFGPLITDDAKAAVKIAADGSDNVQTPEGQTKALANGDAAAEGGEIKVDDGSDDDNREAAEVKTDSNGEAKAENFSVRALPSLTLQGVIFHDENLDGLYGGDEYFSSLSNMSGLLTSPSGAVSPMDINLDSPYFYATGSSGEEVHLGIGVYQLTITNHNNNTALGTALGFTPVTPPTRSGESAGWPGAYLWSMDIPQGVPADDNSPGIAADHSRAVYNFEITAATADSVILIGVGMVSPVTVTFSAGAGFIPDFGQNGTPRTVIFPGSILGSETLPAEAENMLAGYHPGSLMWTLDQDVTLADSNVIRAGMPITGEQLSTAIVMKDLTATASLSPVNYDIIYDYAQGTAPPAENPTGYNAEDIFPIAVPNLPERVGYTFEGWTVDYANAALTDVIAAVRDYQVPSGTSGKITLTAVWKAVPVTPDRYTVVYEPGAHGTFSTQTTTGLKAGAVTPAAPAGTGEPNWKFDGWAPSRNATVTQSVTYIAKWRWNPADNGSNDNENNDDNDNNDDNNDNNNEDEPIVDNTADTESLPDPIDEGTSNNPEDEGRTTPETGLTGQNTPPAASVEQGQQETPVTGAMSPESSQVELPQILTENNADTVSLGGLRLRPWALANLILSISGILLAAFAVLYQKRKNSDLPDVPVESQWQEYDGAYMSPEPRWYHNHSIVRLIASVCLAVFGIIIFFLTEDMRNTMTLFDRWTPVHILLVILESLVITMQIFYGKQEKM